jgi:hypothetical protein
MKLTTSITCLTVALILLLASHLHDEAHRVDVVLSAAGTAGSQQGSLVSVVQAQTLPTLAQCRADLDAWAAELHHDLKATNLSWKEIERRASEMNDCEDAIVRAAANEVKEAETMSPRDYRNIAYWYRWALLTRMENFVTRHDLAHQFTEEDAKGLR